MKKELIRDLCKSICLLVFLMAQSNLFAQIEEVKTIDKSFEVQKGALVKVMHNKGALYVRKSMSNKVEARLYVTVKGKHQEDVKTLLNLIEVGSQGDGRSQLELATLTNIRNWSKYKITII